MLKWELNRSRSALAGVTGDTTVYTVKMLIVSREDDLVTAFQEFLRVVFAEAPLEADLRWDILLFEIWADAGLINAIYTTESRSFDAPAIFKLGSDILLDEYEGMVSRLTDINDAESEIDRVVDKYLTMIMQAAINPNMATVLNAIRQSRSMPIWGTACAFPEKMRPLDI